MSSPGESGACVGWSSSHQGLSDGKIVEVIAHVALNPFTNCVKVALQVPVDFPAVALR